MERIIMHVDFDYFYAQCEELRRPSLRSAPVAVCVFSGRGGDSGAVATANYIARRHGVRSGMPISRARARLRGIPEAEFIAVDFAHYEGVSERAMRVMRAHADVFEYVGRDEAYLDVTRRCGGKFGTAAHAAQNLKNALRAETGLTCSVGVSPNKLVSKIASDHQKPDGLTIVESARVAEFMAGLRVRDIPGLGRRAEERLAARGVGTVEQLRDMSLFELSDEFGRRSGAHLYHAARGEDEDPVAERAPNSQYSRIATLPRDSADAEFLLRSIGPLCASVHGAVMEDGRAFRAVGVQLIHADLSSHTKSATLRRPTRRLEDLEAAASRLLEAAVSEHGAQVRRLGVRVSELVEQSGQRSIDDYA